jgi:hypothetical protein
MKSPSHRACSSWASVITSCRIFQLPKTRQEPLLTLLLKITIIVGREGYQFFFSFREQEGVAGTSMSIFEEDLIRSSWIIFSGGGEIGRSWDQYRPTRPHTCDKISNQSVWLLQQIRSWNSFQIFLKFIILSFYLFHRFRRIVSNCLDSYQRRLSLHWTLIQISYGY